MEIPISIEEVKSRLPIPYVLMRAGVEWEDGFDGKVHAVCPFHDDHEPSLDVFAPNRWNCPPCGRGGDVLDLLSRFAPDLTFGQLMDWAARLIVEMGDWNGPDGGLERPPFDVAQGSALVAQAYGRFIPGGTLDQLIVGREWEFPGLYLNAAFGVGFIEDQIVIPYWSGDGELRTYRTRTSETKPKSAYGTYAPTFYAEWKDEGRPVVVLCEGESDVWAATYALEGRADVLGVPGAGRSPFATERLRDRQVIIAFDGDVAGRAGAQRWQAALPAGALVRVVDPGDGRDLASYSPADLRVALGWDA